MHYVFIGNTFFRVEMIVIPMAGLSSRFTKAGYSMPKYALPLRDATVFDYSLASFRDVFDSEEFLFVARREEGVEAFLRNHLGCLGVESYSIVLLDEVTRGQADSVMIGLDRASVQEDEPLTIFNIDTFLLAPYRSHDYISSVSAGILQVFRGTGDQWSFVEPAVGQNFTVVRTAEKTPISDLCCTGLYYFESVSLFRDAFDAELGSLQAHELFVAPMYNYLIASGKSVTYIEVPTNDVVFCGVPLEYEALLGPQGGRLRGVFDEARSGESEDSTPEF